ncbi:MAG: alpha/beta hydrolase [Chloroflexi bacterium]|nr:alpha/beta hydrolase [Chloroflexota bacterium]
MAEWTEGDVNANGIRIHYRRAGGEGKLPILLLHGITDNGLCWSRVARDLQDSYDVIMTDARGHGRSDGLQTGFSVDILADDAAGVGRALELGRAYVFGHSMGAITALAMAARHPDLARAIVLEDPPLVDTPPAGMEEEREALDRERRRRWALLMQLPREERLAQARAENPAWVDEELIPWAASKEEVSPEVTEHRALLAGYPWRETLARVACPILLVTGDPERQALVTPEVAGEAGRIWKDGVVARIAGAGHNIHRDRYEETMEQVRAFLRAH